MTIMTVEGMLALFTGRTLIYQNSKGEDCIIDPVHVANCPVCEQDEDGNADHDVLCLDWRGGSDAGGWTIMLEVDACTYDADTITYTFNVHPDGIDQLHVRWIGGVLRAWATQREPQ